MWNAGGDPWSRDVWQVERTIDQVDASRDELLPYVGPAAALPLFGAFARLPYAVAVRCWSALLVAALVLLLAAALRLAAIRPSAAVTAAGAAFVLAAGPTTSALGLGQAALLSSAGIAAALAAYERRGVFAGAAATLLAGVQPNLAVALAARMRDRVALVAATAGASAFAALTLAAGGGPAGLARYAARLREHGAAEAFSAIQHTPAAVAHALGASPPHASLFGAAVAVAAVAAVAVTTARLRLTPLNGTLLAIAALPLVVPFFHEHDFAIALIPLLVLAMRARGAARALAGTAAVLVLVDWFGLAQRPDGAAQIVLQAAALACAFAACGPPPRSTRADVAAFAALAIVALPALWLAHAATAPVWPDALPAAFHAAPGLSASAVWSAEQAAAGLDVQQPTWGALRALPLAGCVVLGFAVALAGRRSDVGVDQ